MDKKQNKENNTVLVLPGSIKDGDTVNASTGYFIYTKTPRTIREIVYDTAAEMSLWEFIKLKIFGRQEE